MRQGTGLELTIEKLVYGGEGLARLPADEHGRGKTVFLPFVLPGERVDAALLENRSGFARAKVNKLVVPSPDRVVPECPYFGSCGGCQYQHIAYPAQVKLKAAILGETLRRTAKLDLGVEIQTHSSQPWQYRNRTRMHIRHSPKFALGYFRTSSHELLPVEHCPISSPVINQGIAEIWKLGQEGKVSAAVHGLQFFADHEDRAMLVEIYLRSHVDHKSLSEFAHVLTAQHGGIAGIVFFETASVEDDVLQPAPLSRTPSEATAVGEGHLLYHSAGFDYRVSGGSFFQTNRYLIDELVNVTTQREAGQSAFDLYAGVGLFSVPLAAKFKDVIAVEASPHAVSDLRHNAPNVKTVQATTEGFLQKQAMQYKPDFILLDPPRAGIGEKATAALCRTSASRVTYVSCDPATLSRDLRLLLESGFRVDQAHLFDLFPQTAHMETVLKLVR
jgi:23S rRNA (uracil1939-C5)-methyltransferase